MASIFDLIALGALDFADWYVQAVLGEADFILFVFKQIFMYLLIQIILSLFPFLKRILNALCFPFRWNHVYLHIYSAKEISRELDEKGKKKEEEDSLLDNKSIRASLATGLDRSDENAVFVISFNRVEYAKRVALAPRNFALVMLLGYCVVTPLRFINPPAPLSIVTNYMMNPVGALMHFYFFVGIIGVMMPSLNDWHFVFHTLLLNLDIRPIYLYNSIVVYTVFTLDFFWRTMDFLLSILWGMLMFLLYLVGLFIVAFIAQGGTIRNPDIFFVPYRSPRQQRAAPADLEFWDMDETDELD